MKLSTYAFPVIYVYSINDDKHEGLLKVGLTNVEAESADMLEPNCDELRQRAIARINQQTGTASVDYDLLYTELAVVEIDGKQYDFNDFEVREVLENSGYTNANLKNNNGAEAKEWVQVSDVDIVKKAIAAVKEQRSSLDPSDWKLSPSASTVIKFREEQSRAIEETIARFAGGTKMLWNAKMRFGKTLCALEVIKRQQYRRTLIITHRPSVRSGWFEDFNLLGFDDDYFFGHKKVHLPKADDADSEEKKAVAELIKTKVRKFDVLEENAKNGGMRYIYFASIQDLRGSWDKTGHFRKNSEIFSAPWDLLIVDEAHEGTKTELGQSVIDRLQKKASLRTLYLSGTPYNILDQFLPEEVYSWTYEMEQDAKENWHKDHPSEPNPYEDLPRLELHTYNIDDVFRCERDEESDFFNFSEFFRVERRVKTDADGNEVLEPTGKFVHEAEVRAFLDLMCKESAESNYPFSTAEFRFSLSHTLWVLPGVAEAAALSRLIKDHETLGEYYVINVAGEGDDDQDNSDSVRNVKDNIASHPRTITLTCGRLTTGVSVPEWSAVFMLCGGAKISAAFFLQTIFRAQTPTRRDVFPKKKVCYAFDFAPDRTVEVISEYVQQQERAARESSPKTHEAYVGNTLHFLSIISHEGSQEKRFDTKLFMSAVGDAYKDHIKRRGFRDRRLFVNLGRLTDEQYRAIGEIGKQMVKSGHSFSGGSSSKGVVELAHTGLDNAAPSPTSSTGGEKPPKTPKPAPLPSEPKRPLDRSKEAFKVLGDIYTRLPMLIFGCDLGDDVTLQRILDAVDDESWAVFMPKGVGKAEMKTLMSLKILNEERFAAAASDIATEAKDADLLPVTDRVKAIAAMIARFRFPDKETVLTPWRVVNMHMSDTVGGYDFFEADHEQQLAEPRFVRQEGVTEKVFKPSARILEINSKSGLYPLYVAYSLYRTRLELPPTDLFAPSPDTLEGQLFVWDQVLRENVFVLCMSKMAAKIAHRVLAGYRNVPTNVRAYIDGADLISEIKNPKTLPNVVARLKGEKNFWGNNCKDMNFDAIVGNPPYQVRDGGGAGYSALPIYNEFVNLAKEISPKYISLIMPARWYAGGKGLDTFRETMLKDKRISKLFDFTESRECFPSADIAGGICYLLWDATYNGDCSVTNFDNGTAVCHLRNLAEHDIFIRQIDALGIIDKVLALKERTMDKVVFSRKPFGLGNSFVGKSKEFGNCIAVYGSKGLSYIKAEEIRQNSDKIRTWKVIASKASAQGGRADKNGMRKVLPIVEVLNTRTVCTESYLLIQTFKTQEEAENCKSYVATKFFRYMLSLRAITQNIAKDCFSFVPLQDFTSNSDIDWSQSIADIDRQLYSKYNLEPEETAFIEKMIKPME